MTMKHTSLTHRGTVSWVAELPLWYTGGAQCLFSLTEWERVFTSGARDPRQDGVWQEEEGWSWCGQIDKRGGVHCSFPPAWGQMLFIYSLIKCQTFPSLISCMFFGIFLLTGPFSAPEVRDPSWRVEPEAGSLPLLGALVEVVQVPTTRPHQGVLWREDCTLLCLAG